MLWETVLRTGGLWVGEEAGLCIHLLVGAREWARAPEARDTNESDQAVAGWYHQLSHGAPGQ